MRLILAGLAGTLLLSACGSTPSAEETLAQNCTTTFGDDAEFFDQFIRDSRLDSIETFCDCYASNVATSETLLAIHQTSLTALLDARGDGSADVQQEARAVFGRIDNGELESLTRQQFDDVGEYLEDIGQGLSETGTCPTL